MAKNTISAGSTTLTSPNADDSLYVVGGSAQITGNVDWSAVTQASTVEVAKPFNGSFGTSGAPFVGRVSTLLYYAANGGDFYWTSDGSVSDISPKLVMPLNSNGHLHLVGSTGTVTSAEIAGGQFTVGTSTVVTNLYVDGNARVYLLDDGSTDPTIVRNDGGTIWMDRGATTLTHREGVTYVQGANANTFTTINVDGAGLVITGGANGTITTINCWGGIPDVSGLADTLTITNTNINLALPGAQEFLNHGLITHSSVTSYMDR